MQAHSFLLAANGWVPNNPRFPVIHYTDVFERHEVVPCEMESLFERHGWKPRWRDGIYAYHHYHSNTHEALGVVAGHAWLMLGGPGSKEVDVRAGQVLVVPAGVAHRCMHVDKELAVVGAYPDDVDWDVCQSAPTDIQRERIAQLPPPSSDPVQGKDGVLCKLWVCKK